MQKYVIIVAGGKGNRFKSDIPKQFIKLLGLPILMHSINAFYYFDHKIEIIVVLPAEQKELWKELCQENQFTIKHQVVIGGEYRFYSVKNGLARVKSGGIVAIHDGVRPLIDNETIKRCFKMAKNEGNAVPVVDLVDSVRQIDPDGSSFMVDRSKLRLIQTPQVFRTELILQAFEKEFQSSYTDDASVLEALYPGSIKLVEGNRQNLKITTAEDLMFAEAILKSRHG
jgi:2-C-methyl-D-erythritol 4-phosphate cytidylyltransferase